MSKRLVALAALVGLVLVAPNANAQAAADECSLKVEPLCDAAKTAGFDLVFGEFADVALVAIGLIVVAFVVVLLLWVLFHLKPRRLVRLSAAEKVREMEPGSSAKFKVEVENLQSRLPVDVFLEQGDLPEGWTQEVRTSVILPSGFRIPQDPGAASAVTLGPESKGAHRAVVEVRATSPGGTTNEESIDYELRAVPVFRGKVRKGKAKKVRVTFLVTPHLPKVQIAKVVHQPEHITVGTPVLTRAVLVNKGERDANEVAVLFSLNGQEIDKKIVPALGVSGETEVEFNWTPQSGENRIRVAIAS